MPPRILVVDDHADTCALLADLLRRRGFEVVTADTVASALERAAASPPDLLVSDLGLPDASGLDLLRKLSVNKPLPAIAISGFGSDEAIRQCKAAGFALHFTKPVPIADLVAQIARLIGSLAPA